MNQSHILAGNFSISHVLKLTKQYNPDTIPDSKAALSLWNSGVQLMSQVGFWKSQSDNSTFIPHPLTNQLSLHRKPSQHAIRNWNNVSSIMCYTNIQYFYDRSPNLLIEPQLWHLQTKKYIAALANTCKFIMLLFIGFFH
jgi:hypothetical protein